MFMFYSVNMPTTGPYANFKICYPKCSKYCPESESDGGFYRKRRKTTGNWKNLFC